MSEGLERMQNTERPAERSEQELEPCASRIPEPDGFDWRKCVKALTAAGLLSVSVPESAAASEEKNTERERTTAESVLGPEAVEQLESHGFEIAVPIQADGSGSYVIHLGQTHENPGDKVQKAMTNETAGSFQEKLVDLLPQVASAGEGVVFAEGIAQDMSEAKQIVQNEFEKMRGFADESPTTLTEAQELNGSLNWYAKYATHRLVRNFIPEGFAATLEKQLQQFIETYVPEEDESGDIEVLQEYAYLRGETDPVATLGEAGFSDAMSYLYMQDKIDMQPAEKPETNQAAMAAQHELDAAQDAFKEAKRDIEREAHEEEITLLAEMKELRDRVDDGSDPELQQALEQKKAEYDAFQSEVEERIASTPEAEALEVAELEFARLAHLERERAIYERVSEYEQKNGSLQNVVVVYGGNHEFADVHLEVNANNDPDAIDRGLIEIKVPKME